MIALIPTPYKMSNQLEKQFRKVINENIDMMIKFRWLNGDYKDLYFLADLLYTYWESRPHFPYWKWLKESLSNVKLPDGTK